MAGQGSAVQDNANEDTEYCSNCLHHIATKNFVIHSVHCIRNITLCKLCKEPFPIKEVEFHMTHHHSVVPCEKCLKKMEKWQLDKHNDECPKRPASCQFCDLSLPLDEMPEHESYCGSRTQACGDCGQFIMIKNEKEHAPLCGKEQLKDETRTPPIEPESFSYERSPYESFRDKSYQCSNNSYGSRMSFGEHSTDTNASSYDYKGNALYGKNMNAKSTRHFKARKLGLTEEEMKELIKRTKEVFVTCYMCNKSIPRSEIEDHNYICSDTNTLQREMIGPVEPLTARSNYDHSNPPAYEDLRNKSAAAENEANERLEDDLKVLLKVNAEECPICSVLILSHKLKDHLPLCCEQKTICHFCNCEVLRLDVQEHLRICSGVKASAEKEIKNSSYCKDEVSNQYVFSEQKFLTTLSKCANPEALSEQVTERSVFTVQNPIESKFAEECPICHVLIPSMKYESHVLLCIDKKTVCHFCNSLIDFDKQNEHLKQCEKVRNPSAMWSTSCTSSESKQTSYADAMKDSLSSVRNKIKPNSALVVRGAELEICPLCEYQFDKSDTNHLKRCQKKSRQCRFCSNIMLPLKFKIHIEEECKEFNLQEWKDARGSSKRCKKKPLPEIDYSSFFEKCKVNFSPTAKEAETVMLPCEFCGECVQESEIILHQSGCRPDLVAWGKSSFQASSDLMNEYSQTVSVPPTNREQIFTYRANCNVASSEHSASEPRENSYSGNAVGIKRRGEFSDGSNVSPIRPSFRQSDVKQSKNASSACPDDRQQISKFKSDDNFSEEYEQWKQQYKCGGNNNRSTGEYLSSKKAASPCMTNSEHSNGTSSRPDNELPFSSSSRKEIPKINRNDLASSSFEDKCFVKKPLNKKYENLTAEQVDLFLNYLNYSDDDSEDSDVESKSDSRKLKQEGTRQSVEPAESLPSNSNSAATRNSRSPLVTNGELRRAIMNRGDVTEDVKPDHSHHVNTQTSANATHNTSSEEF